MWKSKRKRDKDPYAMRGVWGRRKDRIPICPRHMCLQPVCNCGLFTETRTNMQTATLMNAACWMDSHSAARTHCVGRLSPSRQDFKKGFY